MITMLLQTALVSAFAAATPQAEDGWLAYSGCWRAENAPTSSLVCFVPDGSGVRMLEIESGVTRETRIIADGKQRPLSLEGCSGVESSRWSADGARLLLRSEMTCGDRTQRKTSGIFAFVLSNQWVSVRAVTVGAQGAANTTRYFEVAASELPANVAAVLPNNRLARETARYAASEQLGFDDVREALAEVEPRAVEALLLAREQPFDLNGKRLLALADAGVPDYVIDAMVAVSHPDVFEVRAPSEQLAVAPEDHSLDPYDRYDRDRSCRSYSPWSVYDRYGCRNSYDYYRYRQAGSLGYSPWGYYNTPVIIIRDQTPSDVEHGKAGKNGYSRGSSSGSDRAKSRDSGSASTSKPSSSSTPSTSSSGSGSSSSSSSGRTAKPRDK